MGELKGLAQPRRAREEQRAILASTLSHFLLHIGELSFPTVATVVLLELIGREKAYDKIGFGYFIFSLLFGINQILGGFLSDKLGARSTIWIYLFGSGLSLMMLGLSQNFWMLVLCLALFGAFLGIYHPAGMALLSRATEKHGSSMGIHGMGGNLGLALSPFIISILAGAFGWRKGFILLGLAPLLFSGWVFLDRRLEFKMEKIVEPSPSQNSAPTKFLFKPLLILFLMSMFNGMCYRGFTTFLPSYFNEKISPGTIPWFSPLLQTGAFSSLVLLLGMFGQLLGGRLADRYPKEKLLITAFLLAVPFLFSLSLLHNWSLLLSAMSFAFFYFANQPIANSLIPKYAGEGIWGRLYGWFFFMNFGAGSIMSWIAGAIAEKIALSQIFIILASLLFLSGALGFFLLRFPKT